MPSKVRNAQKFLVHVFTRLRILIIMFPDFLVHNIEI